jgi:hypothetical protein
MTLVASALVTSGLVTMAFLLALRLLIRDFFEIDIACSLVCFRLTHCPIAPDMPKYGRGFLIGGVQWNQQLANSRLAADPFRQG